MIRRRFDIPTNGTRAASYAACERFVRGLLGLRYGHALPNSPGLSEGRFRLHASDSGVWEIEVHPFAGRHRELEAIA